MQDISVIILTLNEERHIVRAILNARKVAKEIFVVDSFSTDRTIELAQSHGARVFQHEFVTHAQQLQWALDTLDITTEWVLKLDADEYMTDGLIAEIEGTLPTTPPTITGYTMPCLRKFMGREIRHGIVPLILLRLFRTGKARMEAKLMDEHLYVTEGTVVSLRGAFYDDSLITLAEWTAKHNGYADREALDMLCTEYGINEESLVHNTGANSAKVRARKLKYIRLPLFWRCFAFFIYRYFIRLGFLDGKEGFLWHFLQGWWYRTLADAKVYELKKACHWDENKIIQEVNRRLDAMSR